MILIVGGESQGKREFARGLTDISADEAADGGEVAVEETGKFKLIYNLHLLTYNMLKSGNRLDVLPEKLKDKTVICNEIGCGIVPIDPFERKWREDTGRLCCELAKAADKVYRVHCGIGQCVKGEVQ